MTLPLNSQHDAASKISKRAGYVCAELVWDQLTCPVWSHVQICDCCTRHWYLQFACMDAGKGAHHWCYDFMCSDYVQFVLRLVSEFIFAWSLNTDSQKSNSPLKVKEGVGLAPLFFGHPLLWTHPRGSIWRRGEGVRWAPVCIPHAWPHMHGVQYEEGEGVRWAPVCIPHAWPQGPQPIMTPYLVCVCVSAGDARVWQGSFPLPLPPPPPPPPAPSLPPSSKRNQWTVSRLISLN